MGSNTSSATLARPFRPPKQSEVRIKASYSGPKLPATVFSAITRPCSKKAKHSKSRGHSRVSKPARGPSSKRRFRFAGAKASLEPSGASPTARRATRASHRPAPVQGATRPQNCEFHITKGLANAWLCSAAHQAPAFPLNPYAFTLRFGLLVTSKEVIGPPHRKASKAK